MTCAFRHDFIVFPRVLAVFRLLVADLSKLAELRRGRSQLSSMRSSDKTCKPRTSLHNRMQSSDRVGSMTSRPRGNSFPSRPRRHLLSPALNTPLTRRSLASPVNDDRRGAVVVHARPRRSAAAHRRKSACLRARPAPAPDRCRRADVTPTVAHPQLLPRTQLDVANAAYPDCVTATLPSTRVTTTFAGSRSTVNTVPIAVTVRGPARTFSGRGCPSRLRSWPGRRSAPYCARPACISPALRYIASSDIREPSASTITRCSPCAVLNICSAGERIEYHTTPIAWREHE